MSRCYTMNTDLINKTQNITIQPLFNQVITLSLGSMRSFPLQWNSIWGSKDFSQQRYWGNPMYLLGSKEKNTWKVPTPQSPVKWSLFMDQQIHQHLILSSEQKSGQLFWRVTSIISFIFPPSLSRRVLHSLVRVCGEMWDRTLNKPIFAPSIQQLFYFSASILHTALLSLMKMLLTAACVK